MTERLILISHPSTVMLRIMLSGIKEKAEELVLEVQEGFRPNRTVTDQAFNITLLIDKQVNKRRHFPKHQTSKRHLIVFDKND